MRRHVEEEPAGALLLKEAFEVKLSAQFAHLLSGVVSRETRKKIAGSQELLLFTSAAQERFVPDGRSMRDAVDGLEGRVQSNAQGSCDFPELLLGRRGGLPSARRIHGDCRKMTRILSLPPQAQSAPNGGADEGLVPALFVVFLPVRGERGGGEILSLRAASRHLRLSTSTESPGAFSMPFLAC